MAISYKAPLEAIDWCIEKIEQLQQQGGGTSEWEERVKEFIDVDPDAPEVDIGTDLFVDGKIVVNEMSDFQDSYGDDLSLVPKPQNSDLGKFLKVGSTGFTYATAGGGGGSMYIHLIDLADDDGNYANKIVIYNNISTGTTLSYIKNIMAGSQMACTVIWYDTPKLGFIYTNEDDDLCMSTYEEGSVITAIDDEVVHSV